MRVPVSGAVVEWARKFRGLERSEAAKRLGLPESDLAAIETDQLEPTFGQFEKLCVVYKLPQATLFRTTPPREPPKPTDFRTFAGMPPRHGFEYRTALSRIHVMQSVLRRLSIEDEDFVRPQLPQYSARQDPWEAGEIERHRLGVSPEAQLSWTSSEAFRRWRAIIEGVGVSVYQQKFDLDDCRGFTLFDDEAAPAIIVNKADVSDRAKVFTLAHEYAHLLIRQPGLSDHNPQNPVEAFCNRFAAGFLMPRNVLRSVLPRWPNEPVDWKVEQIKLWAGRIKVSQQALALRLEELGIAPAGFHRKFSWHATKAKGEQSGQPNYVTIQLSEIGGRFTAAIIGAFDRGVIDVVSASEALGVQPKRFDKVRASIKRQRELVGSR